ncbi:MAG: hypothetical protein ACQEUK_11955 [Pseudomonadota bacterium]|uniref:hypothetical protein n=1 Tax=Halomonas alkaliantarctica TaxID=232346 RepID=UPI0004AB9B8D|nr:hypothetical protein [Halomonas alkaliantarctica]
MMLAMSTKQKTGINEERRACPLKQQPALDYGRGASVDYRTYYRTYDHTYVGNAGSIPTLALLIARSHMMMSAIENGEQENLLQHLQRIIFLATQCDMPHIVNEAEAVVHRFNENNFKNMSIHEITAHCARLHHRVSAAFSHDENL